jgi:Cu+-exporting ATPase
MKGGENVATDPVCGMDVDENTAKYKTDRMGKTYYFCALRCKEVFDKNPQRFIKK